MNQASRELEQVSHATNQEILAELVALARADRALSVRLLVHLAEVDARRLYRDEGYSSMFAYVHKALHMSEAEAFLRIHAARLSRQFPCILPMLGSGALNLSAVHRLGPKLTQDNHVQLLERARGKTKLEIEALVAELEPRADVPSTLRGLPPPRRSHARPVASLASHAPQVHPAAGANATKPTPGLAVVTTSHVSATPNAPMPAASAVDAARAALGAAAVDQPAFTLESPSTRAACTPLRPGRYKLQVSIGADTHAALSQLKELLRHRMPDGDLARIVELAIADLLQKVLKQRFAQRAAPKPHAFQGAGRKRSNASRALGKLGAQETEPVQQAAADPVAADGVASEAQATVQTAAVKGHAPAGHAMGSPSRHVPRAVRRAVYERDGGQCAFVSPQGKRCDARGYLELHHEVPFAWGGETTVANLKIMCKSHNALLAERDLGEDFMRRKLHEVRGGCGDLAPRERRTGWLFPEREQG